MGSRRTAQVGGGFQQLETLTRWFCKQRPLTIGWEVIIHGRRGPPGPRIQPDLVGRACAL